MKENCYECDVLVIGAGAGGLSTAVTAAAKGLDILVVEKQPTFGGTTAKSGGWLWLPGNPVAKERGFHDSRESAKEYLRHEAGSYFDERKVDSFLDNIPAAIEFFQRNTSVQFEMPVTIPDYHAEAPGGVVGGRSIVASSFDGRELGAAIKNLAAPLHELTVFGVTVASGPDLAHFMHATQSIRSAWYVARRLGKHLLQRMIYGQGMLLVNGNALAGRLAKSAFDLKVPIWLSAPAGELLVDGGRVSGAMVSHQGQAMRISARRGVVLACGGYPHDVDRRARTFPHAPTGEQHYSPAPPGNTGDGLRMGEAVGGHTPALAHAAAWLPVSLTTRPDGTRGINPHFFDKSKPGVIAVTRQGRRFANEGNSYHDFVQSLVAASQPGEVKAYLVCDHRTLRKYGLGYAKPFPFPIGRHIRSGYLICGQTPEDLGRKAGIDPDALAETIAVYNRHAEAGRDPEFHKGEKLYNRYLGDPWCQPNPNVGPLNVAPYYAIKIVVGDLGTFAGLATDGFARVLDGNGATISGLYAVGNDMSSVMGGNYPGAGITLGPALVFGYVAGCHIAGANE